jgi:hypothetical protein
MRARTPARWHRVLKAIPRVPAAALAGFRINVAPLTRATLPEAHLPKPFGQSASKTATLAAVLVTLELERPIWRRISPLVRRFGRVSSELTKLAP